MLYQKKVLGKKWAERLEGRIRGLDRNGKDQDLMHWDSCLVGECLRDAGLPRFDDLDRGYLSGALHLLELKVNLAELGRMGGLSLEVPLLGPFLLRRKLRKIQDLIGEVTSK